MKLVLCTVPEDSADALVDRLLHARLIGCANAIAPVRSRYWWNGAIEQDDEVVLLMETPDDRHAAAVEHIARWHPYDVPKILTFAPEDANAAYAEWLTEVTRPTGD
jgi:periplasmic divalent cation tolerance protein